MPPDVAGSAPDRPRTLAVAIVGSLHREGFFLRSLSGRANGMGHGAAAGLSGTGFAVPEPRLKGACSPYQTATSSLALLEKLIEGAWVEKTGASPQWTSAGLSKRWTQAFQHPQNKADAAGPTRAYKTEKLLGPYIV